MASVAAQLAARRRAIFAACRQLGMDDETRHAMLRKVAGVESTRDLDLRGCASVLEHLRRAGAARSPKAKGVGEYPGTPTKVRRETGALIDKIEAQLADMKLSWNYGVAILRRVSGGWQKEGQLGKECFEFATREDLMKVVAALAYELKKRAMLEEVSCLLADRGLTLDDAPKLLPGLRDGWQRSTPSLRALRVRLQPMPAKPI
jgi:phage gp16-like protein